MKLIARREGGDVPLEVLRHGSGYRVRIGERWLECDLVDVGNHVRSLRLEDGRQYLLVHHRDGNTHQISLGSTSVQVDIIDPLAARRRKQEDEVGAGGMVKALMPGRVVRILVNKGDTVRKGAGLLILEAMKMENEVVARTEGVVDDVFVTAGQTVEGGAELMHIAVG